MGRSGARGCDGGTVGRVKRFSLAKIEVDVHDSGMFATHNMPCPVCRSQGAVLEMGKGGFSPCWECQREGWRTIRLSRFARWLLSFFGGIEG